MGQPFQHRIAFTTFQAMLNLDYNEHVVSSMRIMAKKVHWIHVLNKIAYRPYDMTNPTLPLNKI